MKKINKLLKWLKDATIVSVLVSIVLILVVSLGLMFVSLYPFDMLNLQDESSAIIPASKLTNSIMPKHKILW